MSDGLQLLADAGGFLFNSDDYSATYIGVITVVGPSLYAEFTIPGVPANCAIWWASQYTDVDYWTYSAQISAVADDRIGYQVNSAPPGCVTQIFYGWR